MKKYSILALDIGASSGRGILGVYTPEGGLEAVEEIHRFPNGFVRLNGGLYWDHMHIYKGILECLRKCRARDIQLDCIGVDTWAQDYAYVGKEGDVLSLPRCYRDPVNTQNADLYEKAMGFGPMEHCRRCGTSRITISTFRRLWYDVHNRKSLVDGAKWFLHMPYLLVYMLTGEGGYDDSLMSIGELADARTQQLSGETIRELGIENIVPPRRSFGTIIGRTGKSILEETGYDSVPVACTDGHDTASAVSAIPDDGEFLWISSGTSNMFGAVTDSPCMSENFIGQGFHNTRLGDGRVCIMGGGAGMFYINQCMNFWKQNGVKVSFPELTAYALEHHTSRMFDFADVPDDAVDMPAAINAAIVKAGHAPAETPFELYEAFANSLARLTVNRIADFEERLGKRFGKLYVISGGSQADAVNQRMAMWLGREVYCGLIEAAATGNMLAQLAALDIPVDKNALSQAATNGKMRRFAP